MDGLKADQTLATTSQGPVQLGGLRGCAHRQSRPRLLEPTPRRQPRSRQQLSPNTQVALRTPQRGSVGCQSVRLPQQMTQVGASNRGRQCLSSWLDVQGQGMAGLVSPEGSSSSILQSLSSPCVLTWSPSVCLCPHLLSLCKDSSHAGSGPTPMTLLDSTTPSKAPSRGTVSP